MKRSFLLVLLALVMCMMAFAATVLATEAEDTETTTPTIISTGSQRNMSDTADMFTWELDSNGTLTFYKGTSNALQTASNSDKTTVYRDVEYWRKETTEGYNVTNENLVKTIVVSDGFDYIRNQHSEPVVILGKWPELTKIVIPNGVYFVQNYTYDEGFFDSNPKLTTLWHSGTSENNREGVINLEKVTRVDGTKGTYPNFERMFYKCTAITEVILPAKNTSSSTTNATYQMFYGCTSLKKVNFPAWMTSIGTGMFYNCTSLETLTFPSTVTSIATNALTGCTGLKSITFENPDLTIPSGMVIPDNEGLVINCSSIAQATAINALGLENAKVKLDLSGNFLADGTGYAYTLKDGVLTIEKAETTATTVLSTDVSHGLAGLASTVIITEESGVTAIAANFFDGFIAGTVVVPSTLTDLSAAGIFANMPKLTTIVDYTAYTADTTAGAGIINLLGVTAIADDTFSGSCAALSPVVYIGKSTALPGTAFDWFASDATVTYYVYPTSSAATYFRAKDIAFSYLTVEQTGDSNLVRSGTAVNTDSGNNAFDWSFDETTGVLTYSKNATGSGEFNWREYTVKEIKPWKQTWRDAVKRIVVTGFTSRKLQRNYGGYESPFSNFANLESVHLACYTSNMYITFYAKNTNGWFENCPKLTTVSYGSDDTIDNVIDLSNWGEYTNGWYEMFKGCTSITKVIFPSKLKNSTSNSNYPPAVFSGMFNGCTSLTSITLPSYYTNIEANGFANCSNLKEVIITNPDMTIADSTAFPDIAGLTVVCASQSQYDTITAFGYENVNVVLDITGNLLADGTGFIYALRETADSTDEKKLYNLIVTKGSATVGTALSIDNLSAEYLAGVVAVIIDETSGITELSASVFDGFTALETLVIPSTLTRFGEKSLANMAVLNTVALYNDYYSADFAAEGVIDLRSLTALAADTFEGSFADSTPVIYLAKTADISGELNWVSADSESVTIYTYPSGTAAKAIRNSDADNIIHKYYTYEMTNDSTLLREDAAVSSDFKWTFDEESGKLTITPKVGATASNSSNFHLSIATTVWKDWKVTWTDAIESIYLVNFGGTQIYWQKHDSAFSNLPNLKHVHISRSSYRITRNQYNVNGMFENCPSLTTVSSGSDDTYDEIIDLSGWNSQDWKMDKMFYGCKSIKKVILPTGLAPAESNDPPIIIATQMFYNCSSLESLSIPDCFTGIGQNAFYGCSSLKKVVIEKTDIDLSAVTSTTFPTSTALHVFDAEDISTLKAFGFNVIDLHNPITPEGFKIRYKDYNGLRGMFTFDKAQNNFIAQNGYTLKEYGVIIAPKNEYDYWGTDLKVRFGEYVSKGTAIKKIAVQKGEKIVGSILSNTSDITEFAGSVVKYSSNHTRDLYIGAYIIYFGEDGTEYIIHTSYVDSNGNNCFNLYDMTLSMYKNAELSGIVAADTDEKAVWNTLLQGADTSVRETAVGENNGVTVTLVKENSDSTSYIPFVRSEKGVSITEDMITAAKALVPADVTLSETDVISLGIADQGTTAPEFFESLTYTPTLKTPNRYTRYATNDGALIYGAQHAQGMTMDDRGNIYISFTGLIVKINQQGEEVGVYKASSGLISASAHLGNIYWHEGKIYIGLGISNTDLSKHKRYIGVLDESVFNDYGGYVQDTDENPLLYALNLPELSVNRTFVDSNGTTVARFGGGGIDGITVGKLPGKGYILPAGYVVKEDIKASNGTIYKAGTVLTEEVEVTDNEDYLVAVRTQGSYDTYRYDDDNKQVMVFDFDDITEENLLPMNYDRIVNDDPTGIYIKYNMYVYNGYHEYGTQVICYDKTTGDYQLWTYDRASVNNEFPAGSFYVIDGSKKLRLEEIEVGQSVPESSEYYSVAQDRANFYTDAKDLDNDGDTGERLIGWVATLQCVCGQHHDIEEHEAVVYGDTGYAAKICGLNTSLQGDNGCISLGNDFFYIFYQDNGTALRADGVTKQTAYGGQARIYSLSRHFGKWTFTRVTSW